MVGNEVDAGKKVVFFSVGAFFFLRGGRDKKVIRRGCRIAILEPLKGGCRIVLLYIYIYIYIYLYLYLIIKEELFLPEFSSNIQSTPHVEIIYEQCHRKVKLLKKNG